MVSQCLLDGIIPVVGEVAVVVEAEADRERSVDPSMR